MTERTYWDEYAGAEPEGIRHAIERAPKVDRKTLCGAAVPQEFHYRMTFQSGHPASCLECSKLVAPI